MESIQIHSRRTRQPETPACLLPSHNIKPGRRRRWTAQPVLLLALLALAALCTTADARSLRRPMPRDPRPTRAPGIVARSPEVHLPVLIELDSRQDDPLEQGEGGSGSRDSGRNDEDENEDPEPSSTTRSSRTATRTTARPTASQTTETETETDDSGDDEPTSTELPTVFDSNMGANFTSPSCPTFMNMFKSNQDFNACLPFSLLLQNSQSFFQQSGSPSSLRRILDATCNVVEGHCQGIMDGFARDIRDDAQCGQDFRLGNPLVVSAYVGFVSYRPMFQASCLKASAEAEAGTQRASDTDSEGNSTLTSGEDDDSSSSDDDSPEYCFISSARSLVPADNYIYSLPLGVPLPGASRPTCSPCLRETMGFFAAAAANMSSPLNPIYPGAATQVNSGCGPNWVSAAVQPIEGSEDAAEDAAVGVRGSLGTVAAVALAVILMV